MRVKNIIACFLHIFLAIMYSYVQSLVPIPMEAKIHTPKEDKLENILFTFLIYSFLGQENNQSGLWVTVIRTVWGPHTGVSVRRGCKT